VSALCHLDGDEISSGYDILIYTYIYIYVCVCVLPESVFDRKQVTRSRL
jgi:hypothetical protein